MANSQSRHGVQRLPEVHRPVHESADFEYGGPDHAGPPRDPMGSPVAEKNSTYFGSWSMLVMFEAAQFRGGVLMW